MATEVPAPDPVDRPVVSVIGEAVLRAEPDEAIVLIVLSTLADTPGTALEDVARRSGSLVALLDELGVAPADRSTAGVSVHEEFDHAQGSRHSRGHRASATTSIRLTDLDLIGRVITRATADLDAAVDGPHWQIALHNPVRLEAARQAAAHGRRKAEAYAEGVGATLGELVGMSEPGAGEGTRRRSGGRAARAATAHDMPIEAGEQEVAATIEVTFALVP